jgi:hypothetical protein
MSDLNGRAEELSQLTDALCDGEITREQAARLEELVKSSDGARRFFLDYVRLHWELCWEYTCDRGPAPAGLAARSGSADRPRPVRATRWALKRRPWAIAGTVAAVLLAMALGVAPFLRVWNGGKVGEPMHCATVANTVGAQWSEDAVGADTALAAGRELVLRQGFAEIHFRSGARVLLEGPAVFAGESPNSARLTLGRLTANIPVNEEGFTVHTPAAAIRDLGTEFGVAVAEDGLSEIEVFTHAVEVRAQAPEAPKFTVCAGQAMRVAASKGPPGPAAQWVPAGAVRFVRSLPAEVPSAIALPVAPSKPSRIEPVPPEPACVDLQRFANQKLTDSLGGVAANELKDLPQGELKLAQVSFRIGQSLVRLGGKKLPAAPSQVDGIPIHRRALTLHFLHATQFGGPQHGVADGTLIGRYVFRYADGSKESLPVVYGEDVRDWWDHDNSKAVSRGQVVWTGQNEAVKRANRGLRLYLATWENPHPEKAIDTIDYISEMTNAAPFCVAISALGPPPDGATPSPEGK